MKQAIIIITFLAGINASPAFAQFKKGSVELSLLGGFGSFTESTVPYTRSSSTTIINLSIMPGYYILEGLSFEPELGITIIDPENGSGSSGLSGVANLSYTFAFTEKTYAPFVRIGYGISNGLQLPAIGSFIVENQGSNESSVTIFAAGAGMKFLIGTHAAIRTEIEYRRQSYSNSEGGEYSGSNIGLNFGITILP